MLAIGAATGASRGTTFTCGNNTKGSWVELTASLSAAIDGFTVMANLVAGNMGRLDVGIGASGSETVIAADLLIVGRTTNAMPIHPYDIPIPIASGTRVAIRASAVGAAPNGAGMILGWENGTVTPPTYTALTAHGFAAASSPGADVDPGATLHTKGAWTEIVASTSVAYDAIIVAFSNLNDFVQGDTQWLVDIGVGAAAAETVIIPDIFAGSDSALDFVFPLGGVGPFAIDIPSGSRIAARAQGATTKHIGVAVYGLSGGASGGGVAGSNVSIWDGTGWVS